VFPRSRTNEPPGLGAFRALWLAQTVSSVGTQLSLIALPLAGILYVQAGAFEIGLLATLETLPYLIVSLPVGVLVDRVDRRRLLILADVGRAVALGAVPIAFALGVGSFALLCLASLVVGALSVVFTIAQQAYVPELLPSNRLIAANQQLEISESGARVVGPTLGGAVIALGGTLVAIASDAASYVASAVTIIVGTPSARSRRGLSRSGEGQRGDAGKPNEEGWLSAIRSGISTVARDRLLRDLMFSTAIFNLASGMVLAQVVLFSTRDLGLAAAQFGVIYGIGNVGFVAGALLVGRFERRFGAGALLLIASTLGAVALLLIGAAGLGLGAAGLLAGRLVGAFSGPLFNVPLVSLRQIATGDELRGRVAATFRFVDWGTAPIGALLSGVIGAAVGLPAVMVVAGVLGVLSTLWIAFGPTRRARVSQPDLSGRRERPVSLPLSTEPG
jgi:MFS family permease